MGFGGDDHAAVGDPNGGTILMRVHDRSVISAPKTNVTISDNTWDVSAAQARGPYATIADCDNLVVRDNDTQGSMTLTSYRCTNVMESGNS
jgi:hypothetical protein